MHTCLFDDALTEGNETVIVTLASNWTGGFAIEEGVATVTIIDTVIRVTANPASTTEGSGTPGKFIITREGDFASELKVAYGLSGTATNGLDYETISGEIVIPASSGTVERNVTALVDSELEGSETVILTIAEDPIYHEVDDAQASATITILDGNVQAGAVIVERRTWDPLTGQGWEQTGNVQTSLAFDLDRSPGRGQALDPRLVYNSDQVSVRPIFQVQMPNPSMALPPNIHIELTWNPGPSQQVVTQSFITTGFTNGQLFCGSIQLTNAVTATGRYRWKVKVTYDYTSTGDLIYTSYGSAFVVTQDSSAYGAGWSWSMLDRLHDISALATFDDPDNPGYGWSAELAGKLRVYGTGGWRFYADNGSGGYTSPLGDTGVLAVDGGNFRYTSESGTRRWFNSAGLQTAWESADGTEATVYTYADGLESAVAIDGAGAWFTYADGLLNEIHVVATGKRYIFGHVNDDLMLLTNPDGGTVAFFYDLSHRMISRTDGSFYTQSWTYNSAYNSAYGFAAATRSAGTRPA